MKYENYSVQMFLQDETFVSWVKKDAPEARLFWSNWLKKYPETLDAAIQARKIILSISYKNSKVAEESVYYEILNNVQSETQTIENNHITPIAKRSYATYKYAAAVVFLITFSAVIYWFQYDQLSHEPIAKKSDLELIEKHSPRGTKLSFILKDGTYVKLNSESSLSFPKRFGQDERVVTLIGEAFFNVAKDNLKPFIINSGDLEITVTGTAFNIKAYPGQKDIEVSVLEGTVKVLAKTIVKDQRGVELNALQIASFSKGTNILSVTDLKDQRKFAWRNNIIEFRGENFEEVERILSRWFNVDFINENKTIIPGKLTGKFENKSLKEILEGLEFASNFNFRIEDNHIYINNNNN